MSISPSSSSGLMPKLLISSLGVGLITWFNPLSGLITLLSLLGVILLVPKFAKRTLDAEIESAAKAREFLAEKLGMVISHRIEGNVFGYSKRLIDGAREAQQDLSRIEDHRDETNGRLSLMTYSLMGLSVILNAIVVMASMLSEEASVVEVATPVLLPLVIFDSIRKMMQNQDARS